MVKTTLYLPEELKDALREEAVRTHTSEADLIRKAILQMLDLEVRAVPRFGQFRGDPLTVEEIDQALADGFGEQ